MTVPSNLIPFRITQLPVDPSPSVTGILMYVRDGVSYQVTADQIVSVTGVPLTRQVNAGTGLTGGGALSSNVTISVAPGGIGSTELAASGVTPGVYGSDTAIPVLTIDATGRVTAATTAASTVSGFVPTTRQVIAGTGLNGGGTLASNVTLNANLSDATPEAVDTTGFAGVSTDMSRADHKHPAIDLSDDDQVDNILGLGNGGTAKSIVPDAGAVVWCGADGFYLTQSGANGLLLTSGGTGAPTWTTAGIGTVLSVDVSGGSTGLTTSGGPIVNSGVITLAGTLAISAGGTGVGATPTNGQLLIGDGAGYVLSGLTAGSGISITNATGSITIANTGQDQTVTISDGTAISVTGTYPSFTVTNTAPDQTVILTDGGDITVGGTYPSFTLTNAAPDQTVTLTDGTAISVTGTYPSFTVTNTLPDQTVVLTDGTAISVTGTYPSFTISSTSSGGTVTDVDVSSTLSGITATGGPITTSGVITIAGTLGISSGGTGLGAAPTNGQLLIGDGAGFVLSTLTQGSGVTITSATGSITIAATGSGGTVTSVDSSSTVSGFTLTGGPITGAGIITLAGTLAISNGGTGTSTATGSGAVVLQSSAVLNSLTITEMLTTSLVVNLNADLLDGQSGAYYLDLANATGTLSGGAY